VAVVAEAPRVVVAARAVGPRWAVAVAAGRRPAGMAPEVASWPVAAARAELVRAVVAARLAGSAVEGIGEVARAVVSPAAAKLESREVAASGRLYRTRDRRS
jgi:hypothetical protein